MNDGTLASGRFIARRCKDLNLKLTPMQGLAPLQGSVFPPTIKARRFHSNFFYSLKPLLGSNFMDFFNLISLKILKTMI